MVLCLGGFVGDGVNLGGLLDDVREGDMIR